MRRIHPGRHAALLLAIALSSAACASSPTATETTTTTTLAATTSTAPPASEDSTSTSTTVAGEEAAIRAQIDELIAVTEDLRELKFLEPPTVTLVSDDELAARLREQIDEELDPADLARDTALQVLLGLIEPGTDLLALYTDLYSEQVAGYYDGDAREMVIPAGEDLNALQKVTLVHELTHALTDQHFGFSDRMDDLDEQQRYDELSALQGLVEGDATFTEILYVTELSAGEQLQVLTLSLDQDTSVYDRTPRFIQELLLFPYTQGRVFAQALWGTESGFDHINAAYLDAPTTTEQLYHPTAYTRSESGMPVHLPTLSLPGYTIDEESVWGELSFRVMFEQALDSDAGRNAAEGWGGDVYKVFWDGEEVAFVLLYEGDAAGDNTEMYDALVAYATSAMDAQRRTDTDEGVSFTGEDFVHVGGWGSGILFVAASDPGAGGDLLTGLSGP